ncbi:beta-ketoacyl synthase N-terminal-like domain-containing protein [Oleiphilus messinensis]|nr:beta-ketoacyl synthase N-terminal-like domain-containing protein [Oleiphilus messinensis]
MTSHDSTSFSIKGVGMLNPAGLGAMASSSAIRAGISQYAETDYVNPQNVAIKMALVPDDGLPTWTGLSLSKPDARYQRMMQLAVGALSECLSAGNLNAPVPLFLALPEKRPGRDYPALEPFLKELSLISGDTLDLVQSRIFSLGRAGGMFALASACECLQQGQAQSVIVGGVDSYLDPTLLGILDHQKRLMLANSADGFIPGEGAAFVILEADENGKVQVAAPGVGSEPGHYYSDATCEGQGLTEAITQALDNAALKQRIQTVVCSLNGEGAHSKEWGASCIRVVPQLAEDLVVEHPAECCGDLGAATVPTLLAHTSIGMAKGFIQGPALLWASSDFEPRGAAVMTFATKHTGLEGDMSAGTN